MNFFMLQALVMLLNFTCVALFNALSFFEQIAGKSEDLNKLCALCIFFGKTYGLSLISKTAGHNLPVT